MSTTPRHPAALHIVHRRQPPLTEAEIDRIARDRDRRDRRQQRDSQRQLVEAIHQKAECQAAYVEGYDAGRAAGRSERLAAAWRWAFASGALLGLLMGAGAMLLREGITTGLRHALRPPPAVHAGALAEPPSEGRP